MWLISPHKEDQSPPGPTPDPPYREHQGVGGGGGETQRPEKERDSLVCSRAVPKILPIYPPRPASQPRVGFQLSGRSPEEPTNGPSPHDLHPRFTWSKISCSQPQLQRRSPRQKQSLKAEYTDYMNFLWPFTVCSIMLCFKSTTT